jgi:hypothetical protein
MTHDLYSADKVNKLEKRVKQLESNLKTLVKFINDNRLTFDKKEVNKLKSHGFLNDFD